MARFNALLVGSNQHFLLDIGAENLGSLMKILINQRFLVGRFAAEADDLAMTPVMIPISRIQLLYEVGQ